MICCENIVNIVPLSLNTIFTLSPLQAKHSRTNKFKFLYCMDKFGTCHLSTPTSLWPNFILLLLLLLLLLYNLGIQIPLKHLLPYLFSEQLLLHFELFPLRVASPLWAPPPPKMPSVSLKPTLNPHKFHFSKAPHHNFPSSQLYFSRAASHSNFPSSLLSFPNSYKSCSLSLTKKCYCKVGSYEHWVSSPFFSYTTKKKESIPAFAKALG